MTEEQTNDKSLKETIKELVEVLKEDKEIKQKKKEKKFFMPFKGRVSKQQVKKGWATIMKINENRTIDFTKTPIEEQTYMLDGIPRIATPQDSLIYKGKPFIIQPSWSVKPFSAEENLQYTIQNNNNSVGYKLLLNRIKMEVVATKKTISMAMIIGIGILVIVGGYLAFQGGLFN